MPVKLYYATRDGQSRRVAQRIAGYLGEHGHPVTATDLAEGPPAPDSLAGCRLVIVVTAVRYGRHLPEADRLLSAYGRCPSSPPLAVASVNLTARKPGKDTAEGNAYLRKAIRRHRLRPVLATAIAGRLDYARYGWLDRQMIRFIMKLTGGPTDPASCVEFTAWDKVDAFAAAIANVLGRQRDQAPPQARW